MKERRKKTDIAGAVEGGRAEQGPKPPYTYEVRLLDNAGSTRVLHQVRLAGMSPGLSVQPGGTAVLVSGAATIGQDLFRIENFR